MRAQIAAIIDGAVVKVGRPGDVVELATIAARSGHVSEAAAAAEEAAATGNHALLAAYAAGLVQAGFAGAGRISSPDQSTAQPLLFGSTDGMLGEACMRRQACRGRPLRSQQRSCWEAGVEVLLQLCRASTFDWQFSACGWAAMCRPGSQPGHGRWPGRHGPHFCHLHMIVSLFTHTHLHQTCRCSVLCDITENKCMRRWRQLRCS